MEEANSSVVEYCSLQNEHECDYLIRSKFVQVCGSPIAYQWTRGCKITGLCSGSERCCIALVYITNLQTERRDKLSIGNV